MRQHRYANTTAQQQPHRPADRQQQQCSGAADCHLLPVAAAPRQVSAGFTGLPQVPRTLRLVIDRPAVQAG